MIIQIDLKRNPDVSSLIADMEMGEKVCFRTSLKSKSENLAEFTLEKAEEAGDDVDNDDAESEEESEEDGDEERDESKMPAPGGSPNTPGGSVEQDRLAASSTAQL